MNTEQIYAEAVRTGNNATTQKEYLHCVKLLMSIAEHHPKAGYELFVIFKNVFGDIEKACFYLQLSVKLGNPRAEVKLGEYLSQGVYYQRDEATALKLMEPHADSYPYAACAVGCMYIMGEQIPHDHRKGMQYLLKASQMGFAKASLNIALICLGKTEIPPDMSKALDWLVVAADQGSGDACHLALSLYYERGDMKNAYVYAQKGARLGHAQCAQALEILHRELYPKSRGVSLGIYQSTENEAEFSYTGQAQYVQDVEERRAAEAEKRARNRDTMVAVAAQAGGGYVDELTGDVFGNDGKIYHTDMDTHFVSSEKGSMLFDDSTKTLYGNDNTYHFDKDMTDMYDSQRKKHTAIIK